MPQILYLGQKPKER